MKFLSLRPVSGFTLIEALVALLVLAVGVLGLASMQLKALQGAHLSYQRSVATMAAQDMVERLWVQLGKTANSTEGPTDCPSAIVDAVGSTESVLDQWHKQWVEFIPTLVKDDNQTVVKNGCRYTINVQWEDSRFLEEDVSELVYITSIIGAQP